MSSNPFKVLGISSFSSLKEVKDRYHELCHKYHPDNPKTGDTQKFLELNKAYKQITTGVVTGNTTFKKASSVRWRHDGLFKIVKEEVG